jgi:hypothetical protein
VGSSALQQKWRIGEKASIVRRMRVFLFLLGFYMFGCGVAVADPDPVSAPPAASPPVSVPVAHAAADAVPATSYFPVLPFEASPDAAPQWIPVAANHPLDGSHAGIARAIVVIHDASRDANGALAGLSALAGDANEVTMILAPQFLLPSDLARFADHLPDKGHAFAAWQVAGWQAGDDSVVTPNQKSLSSFTVVDLLLMYLTDRDKFPDLKTITVAGFGAGANFVQRYAALGVAADVIAPQNIELRYLVADASAYLYPTATRPIPAGKGGGMKGFGRPDATACPDYNAYPYGLDRLNPYGRRGGANAAKTGYGLHFITYINAVAPDAVVETNCAALIEGADSAARAVNYKAYLNSLYGDVAARTQNFVLASGAKNDEVGLFGSDCGMSTLFGDGICAKIIGGNP